MTVNEIKADGHKITAKVDMIPKINSEFESTKIIGNAIISFSKIFKKLKPGVIIPIQMHANVLVLAINKFLFNNTISEVSKKLASY